MKLPFAGISVGTPQRSLYRGVPTIHSLSSRALSLSWLCGDQDPLLTNGIFNTGQGGRPENDA
jgi:hypothetical protein